MVLSGICMDRYSRVYMQKADFLLTLHTATRLTLMFICILFRDECSLFLLIQESCMFLAKSTTEVHGG